MLRHSREADMGRAGGATLEQRQERAIACWAASFARRAHTHRVIQQTRWLVASSRALLDGPGRLLRGGVDERPPDVVIRARLRALIEGDVLPRAGPQRLWAGPSRDGHSCIACELSIAHGETEFELTTVAGVVVFLHRHCVELWAQDARGSRH
jgi:hypothetical protein